VIHDPEMTLFGLILPSMNPTLFLRMTTVERFRSLKIEEKLSDILKNNAKKD